MAKEDKQAKAFAQYLSDKKVVVADTNSASRAGLAKILIGLGAKTANVSMCPNFDEAADTIQKQKPHVVICDYDLGRRCGLDLLQEQRRQFPEMKNTLFILVTGNTSQSAVAQAAEEDIDSYILKPYTVDTIRQTIMKTAMAKLHPSDYVKTIEEGKKLLFDGKIKESMVLFEKAQAMDSKPALACFYYGQAEAMQKQLENAKASYDKGLEHNKIHYKCMVGLFENLMERKQYKDSYEVVKRLSRYFPANPHRLAQVLRLAVMTSSYEDIERYYQVFMTLDERNEELIKYICAALVVCGKFYLNHSHQARALELFQKAGTTAAGRTKILREIITTLVQNDLATSAQDFLKRFPAQARNGSDFLTMEYLVNDKLIAPTQTIEAGRKLLSQQVYDPLIYKVLIKRSKESGYEDYVENLMADIGHRWPDLKKEFTEMVASISPQKPEKEKDDKQAA